MNRVKKYICLFTVLAIIAGCLPLFVFAASVDDLVVSSAGKITGCSQAATGDLVIPETINGKTITAIGKEAFMNCGISSVEIPATVTKIEDRAFMSCRSLTKATMKSADITFGNYVFAECDNLSQVTLPSQLTEIKAYDFSGCLALTGIAFPSTLVSIGDSAFAGSGLAQVTIPASVETIGKNAFANCINNRAFYVDSSNPNYKRDSKYALYTHDGKELIAFPTKSEERACTVPEGVEVIGELAFAKNTNIQEVALPSTLKEIGPYAFSDCTSLAEVSLNEGLETIGTLAFKNCTALKNITIPSTVTEFDSAFYNCGLTNVVLSEGVTVISRAAFDMCKDLESVSVPDSLTTVSAGAFKDCNSLTTLDMPANVTSIHPNAFLNIKDSIVLYVEEGSYAMQFAQENNIQYEAGFFRIVINATGGTFADGSKTKSYKYKTGDTVSITLESPSRTGYTFTGWSSVLPETMPDYSLNISASWEKNSYTVTTVIDGVSKVYTFEYGDPVEIENPKATAGKAFSKWKPALPTTMPAKNMTVTAVFSVVTKIAIKNNSKGEKTINTGDILKMEAQVGNPVDGGYIKWSTSTGETKKGSSFSISPEKGTVTVTATAVDANGKPLLDDNGKQISDSVKVTVNSGFFQVIISFFKNLFKVDRSVYLP
ncbi:MAG: leucine-rich repeat protein [Clostridia bacterium]|nr:leucine-rich repeat protein [Clostridia bacterium]